MTGEESRPRRRRQRHHESAPATTQDQVLQNRFPGCRTGSTERKENNSSVIEDPAKRCPGGLSRYGPGHIFHGAGIDDQKNTNDVVHEAKTSCWRLSGGDQYCWKKKYRSRHDEKEPADAALRIMLEFTAPALEVVLWEYLSKRKSIDNTYTGLISMITRKSEEVEKRDAACSVKCSDAELIAEIGVES